MKKRISIPAFLLSLITLCSLCACSGNPKPDGIPDSKSESMPNESTYLLYTKDSDVYLTDITSGSGKKIAIKDNWSGFLVSENSRYIFYFSKADLYRSDLNDPDTEPIIICKDVRQYHLSPDGETVTYQNNSGDLVQKKGAEGTEFLIATNAELLTVSSEADAVLYLLDENGNDNLYYEKIGGEPILLASNATQRIFDPDLSFVVFIDQNCELYRFVPGKGSEKVASDADSLYYSGDNHSLNSFFYSRHDISYDGKEFHLWNEFHFWDNGQDTLIDPNLYRVARLYENAAYYNSIDQGTVSLRYFDGKKSVTVSEDTQHKILSTRTKPVILYWCTGKDDANGWNIAVAGTPYKLPDVRNVNGFYDFCYDDGKYVYFVDVKAETAGNELKRVAFDNPSKIETLDVDVSEGYGIANGYYFYNVDGDLYVTKDGKKEKIAESIENCEITYTDGKPYFLTDSVNGRSTLWTYDGKAIKIDEDIAEIVEISDGKGGDRVRINQYGE